MKEGDQSERNSRRSARTQRETRTVLIALLYRSYGTDKQLALREFEKHLTAFAGDGVLSEVSLSLSLSLVSSFSSQRSLSNPLLIRSLSAHTLFFEISFIFSHPSAVPLISMSLLVYSPLVSSHSSCSGKPAGALGTYLVTHDDKCVSWWASLSLRCVALSARPFDCRLRRGRLVEM